MDRFDVFGYRTFMDPDTPAVAPHATSTLRHADTSSVAESLLSK
jgi:hypothetical protein